MKNHLKYWLFIILLTVGPTICTQLFFRFFRVAYSEDTFYLGIVELLFSAFLLPLYLLTMYYFTNKKLKIPGLNKGYAFLIFACILISARLDFMNWWGTGGKSLKAETRDVVEIGLVIQFLFGLLVSEIGLLIMISSYKTTKIFLPKLMPATKDL